MPKIKKLTQKQMQKADKIIQLLRELGDENIKILMCSSPSLNLIFLRTDAKHMEFNEISDAVNGDNAYTPNQSYINYDMVTL